MAAALTPLNGIDRLREIERRMHHQRLTLQAADRQVDRVQLYDLANPRGLRPTPHGRRPAHFRRWSGEDSFRRDLVLQVKKRRSARRSDSRKCAGISPSDPTRGPRNKMTSDCSGSSFSRLMSFASSPHQPGCCCSSRTVTAQWVRSSAACDALFMSGSVNPSSRRTSRCCSRSNTTSRTPVPSRSTREARMPSSAAR